MDLDRRRIEWQVLKRLCRELTESSAEPLWDEAGWLCPDDFSHGDLGKVFRVLRAFRREQRRLLVSADELADALRAELGWMGLGGFSVECLLSRSSADPAPETIRDHVQMMLGAGSRRW